MDLATIFMWAAYIIFILIAVGSSMIVKSMYPTLISALMGHLEEYKNLRQELSLRLVVLTFFPIIVVSLVFLFDYFLLITAIAVINYVYFAWRFNKHYGTFEHFEIMRKHFISYMYISVLFTIVVPLITLLAK